ncbi:MAG: FtsW/RodA/SpoVE family cell cycle protein [Streptosporangiales bacterium]|nr:FtsW/RodA/SpoVE family cell cycle protein [Streptosporangiales bacterium]
MGAYAAAGLGMDGQVPAGMLGYGLGFGALVAVAHGVMRWVAPWSDPLLLPLATMLNGIGLVMIWRIQLPLEQLRKDGVPVAVSSATSQLMWTGLGIALFVAVLVMFREPRVLQRYTYLAGFAGLVLLAIPALLPASMSSIQGAKIWIRIGGFSIQPGEFAKLALLVFFAGYLVAKRDVLALAGKRLLFIDLPRARDLGPILIVWFVSMLVLVAERDLGTSLLFFGTFLVLLYVATQRTSWVLIGLALFAGGAFIAYQLFSHVQARFDIWLNPWAHYDDPIGGSFQLVKGLFGLAAGGVLGTGLGQGRPQDVPLSQSDFIVTSIGEELGLTGLMAVLLIYVFLVERGLRTAIATRDPFVKLFAAGLAFIITLQVFIVVGGVTRLIPLTGLTTPFLSAGGSSLLANWVIIALLARMSDTSRRPAPQSIQDEGMTQVFSR